MKVKKIPQRLCVACQTVGAKRELIRIIRSPEGEVSVDLTGKKPGRGVYICKSKECLQKALKEKKLEKGLRVSIDQNTQELLVREIEAIAE